MVSFAPSLILSAASGAIMNKVGTKIGARKEMGADGEGGGEAGDGGDDDNGAGEGGDGDEADNGDESGEAAALESFHQWYISQTGTFSP